MRIFLLEMPRLNSIVRLFFPISLPSVNSYLAFSSFLFLTGLYYYYRIAKTLKNANLVDAASQNESITDVLPERFFVDLVKKVFIVLKSNPLLFYILLNTCCACITLFGKLLISCMFGWLNNQEASLLRKCFRRFISTKITFIIFISHHNLFEDIIIWTPWLAMHALCLLLLELTALRLSNAHNLFSNGVQRRRLLATTCITGSSSLLMIPFIFAIKDYINLNYCLFLGADCCIVLLQSLHLLCKLSLLADTESQRGTANSVNSSYYLDIAYEMVRDCMEFANYLHMIFYSQLAITYCCVFLVVQAQHYYSRISTKIRKYWQQQELLRHISSRYSALYFLDLFSISYGIASEEDLLKSDQCTICWQPMKTARKLPCSHIFHEHWLVQNVISLRRWLEQDSSCAICRQTLTLNLTYAPRQQANIAGEENALQVLLEAFSPQNNRLARWWTRFLFESMNEDQVNAMVSQVSEMFPQIPVDAIRQLISTTGSATVAVEILLAGNGGENNAAANAPQNQAAAPNNDGEFAESSSDETYDSSEGDAESNSGHDADNDTRQRHNQPSDAAAVEQQTASKSSNFLLKTNNARLRQQMEGMLTLNRKKYLNSRRAHDIRDFFREELM